MYYKFSPLSIIGTKIFVELVRALKWNRIDYMTRGPGGDSLRKFLHRSYTVMSCVLSPTNITNPAGKLHKPSIQWTCDMKSSWWGTPACHAVYSPSKNSTRQDPSPNPTSSPQWCPCDEWWDTWHPTHKSPAHIYLPLMAITAVSLQGDDIEGGVKSSWEVRKLLPYFCVGGAVTICGNDQLWVSCVRIQTYLTWICTHTYTTGHTEKSAL